MADGAGHKVLRQEHETWYFYFGLRCSRVGPVGTKGARTAGCADAGAATTGICEGPFFIKFMGSHTVVSVTRGARHGFSASASAASSVCGLW